MNSVDTKIVYASLDEYMKIREFLTTYKVPHYIYDNLSAKPLKMVLRGLPPLDKTSVKTKL